jgi:gliding motility-associated-like protein
MKVFLLQKMKRTRYAWVILLFLTFHTVKAQCPSIPISPQVICDSAGINFSDLNAFATAVPANSVRWYLSATGGIPVPQTQLVQQGTYYAGDSTGVCGTRPALIVDFTVNPTNQGLDAIFCSNENPTIQTYIDNTLAVNIPTGGSIQVFSDFSLTMMLNPSTVLSGNANYFLVFVNSSGCRSQIETGSTAVFPSPAAPLPPSVQQFCSDVSPTVADLTSGTTANFNWYEDVDAFNNPIPPALVTTAALINGATYYVQSDNFFCQSNPTSVVVQINEPVNAGISNALDYCEDNIPVGDIQLFPLLGPDADTGGTWSGPLTTSNGDQGTVNISGQTIGIYSFVYTVTGTLPCPDDTAVITIEISPAPESGNYIGTAFTICEDQAAANSPYDLFNLLDGTQDTNGTWFAGTPSTGTAVSNSIDLTLLGIGSFDFTYTVPAVGTCTDVDVVVTVVVNELPNTGIATPLLVCENDLAAISPLDLFGQLSGQDAGGTWSDDDATGALTGSDVDLTGFLVGSYNFSYSITDVNGCSNSSTVVVTVLNAPNAGTATNIDICLTDITTGQILDLFNQLTGNDPGGTWSDDNATGQLTGALVSIASLGIGTYNFTYVVSPSLNCSADMETVQVTINDIAAPIAPAVQDFCDQATVFDLQAIGTGLQWYEDASLSNALDVSDVLLDGEDYFATQTDAATNCESNNAVVVLVRLFIGPNSGVENPITICNDQNMLDLFTALDGTQDTGGTWIDTDATGSVTGNIFDATTVPDGTYTFEYVLSGNAPCIDASTLVRITIKSPVDAGTDAVLDRCSDTPSIDLFTLLGMATSGGTWSPALNSTTGLFDPAIDVSATYTYTIANSCNSSSAAVIVTITEAPDAGTDTIIAICVSDGIVDLSTQLGGSPDTTGTWSPLLDSATHLFDPAVDAAGIYRYTVPATFPCTTDAVATIEVQIGESPAPALISAALDFCAVEDPAVIDLHMAVSGDMILWYAAIDGTIPLEDGDSLTDGTAYFASQTGANGCESSTRTEVLVTIVDAPTPSLNQDGELFCINDNPTLQQLTFNLLEYNSMVNNVVWYTTIDGMNAVPLTTIMTSGTIYYAVLIDPVTGCESSVRLQVTVDLSACRELTIPDGFSPNGDGVNESFDIDNLNFLYPNFSIYFYNRYGSLVYEGTANTPRFNGFSNQPALLNDGKLPVGVYYYILKFNDGTTKPSQGRIYLSR